MPQAQPLPPLSPQTKPKTSKPRRLRPWLIATAVVAAGMVAGFNALEFLSTNRPHYDWRVGVHVFSQWAWLAAGSSAGAWFAIKVIPRTPRRLRSIFCLINSFCILVALTAFIFHAGFSAPHIGHTITEGAVQLRPVRDLGFYAIEIRVGETDVQWSADYHVDTESWLIATPPTTPWTPSRPIHAAHFPLRVNSKGYTEWFEEQGYPKAAVNFAREAQELERFTADQWQLGSARTPLTSFTPDWFDLREHLWIPRRGVSWAWPFLAAFGFFACACCLMFWTSKPIKFKPDAL